jgi:hypothetical protein
LDWWISQNTQGRHIWPGLYTSRVASDEGKTWNLKEILDQVETTRRREGSTGVVHFSMKAFLVNAQGINGSLSGGLYAHRALVPESPWLATGKIAQPKARAAREDGRIVLHLSPGNRTPVRFYTIRVHLGRWMEPRLTSDGNVTLMLDPSLKPDAISVSAVDRVGTESESVAVDVSGL